MLEFMLAGAALASVLLWGAVWESRRDNRRDARLLAALGATGAVSSLTAYLT